ncbi:MAG: cysteine desulfurase [Alphaproteobacteria bacterium]
MTAQMKPDPMARNAPYDLAKVRADFPILARQVHGKKLVYLDNGASAQKPRAVIDGMSEFYQTDYANIHRGVHYLSQVATDRYEKVRDQVARFLNAASREEIVFTKNSTEAINLVAQSFGRPFFKAGDEIVISHMEHHANIVPWQILAQQIGVVVRVVPIDETGELRMDEFAKLLTARTKLVAMTHVSNVLGTITPAREIVRLAHDNGIPVLLDGSQAVVHQKIDVQALDVDFYCFTGHKLYGPTGVGVLYGKAALLDTMPPYQGGGDMIASVSFDGTKFREPPYRFEAGTPAIAEVIGLGFAIDYVERLGIDAIAVHEHDLLRYATAKLSEIPGLRIYGTAPNKCAIVSFTLGDVHPHDVGTIVDRQGVAIRAGHHCAEPLMQRLGVAATARASFALYNTRDEVDALAAALRKTQEMFA